MSRSCFDGYDRHFIWTIQLIPDYTTHPWVDTLKSAEHRFETRDALKKVICLSIWRALLLLWCHFHMNLNIQNSCANWWWPLAVFYPQSLSCEVPVIDKSQGDDPVISILPTAGNFLWQSVPSLVDFQSQYYFRSFLHRRAALSASPGGGESRRQRVPTSASPSGDESLRWQIPASASPGDGESLLPRVPAAGSPCVG